MIARNAFFLPGSCEFHETKFSRSSVEWRKNNRSVGRRCRTRRRSGVVSQTRLAARARVRYRCKSFRGSFGACDRRRGAGFGAFAQSDCGGSCSSGFEPVSEAGPAALKNWKAKRGSCFPFRAWDNRCLIRKWHSICWTALARPVLINYARRANGCARRQKRAWMENAAMPAIQMVHAPVFYGSVFSATGVFDPW